jgi:hypothetical protein
MGRGWRRSQTAATGEGRHGGRRSGALGQRRPTFSRAKAGAKAEFIPAISAFSAFDRLWGMFFYEGNFTAEITKTAEGAYIRDAVECVPTGRRIPSGGAHGRFHAGDRRPTWEGRFRRDAKTDPRDAGATRERRNNIWALRHHRPLRLLRPLRQAQGGEAQGRQQRPTGRGVPGSGAHGVRRPTWLAKASTAGSRGGQVGRCIRR